MAAVVSERSTNGCEVNSGHAPRQAVIGRRSLFFWTLFFVSTIIAEFLFFLVYRRINLDEGWYLGAARLVYLGQLLYADFAYTQTPLLPYVYGLFQLIFGVGLLQGRILTVLLALGTWLLSVATARRLAGPVAGFLCLALLATSLFAVTQYTYTATYALTALLMAGAIYVSLLAWPENWRNGVAAALASLAVCTRLSTVVILPPLLLYLLLTSQRKGRAFWLLGAVTGGVFGLVIGAFWLHSTELFLYDIWGFHLDRILRTSWQVLKIRNRIIRTAFDFGVPILLTIGGGLWSIQLLWQQWRQPTADYGVDENGVDDKESGASQVNRRRAPLATLCLTLMVAGLFVAHLVPRTTDSYYNALQLPMMSVVGGTVAAAWLQRWARNGRATGWFRLALLMLLGTGILAHAALQMRAVARDGALTEPLHNQLATVRETAAIVQQYVAPGEHFLTFNQHLALEADRPTPPGYEMSIFAYRPTWDEERARHYKVINNEMLLADLARPMAAAAFTEFDLGQIYGERDAFFAILQQEYRWFYTIDHFGPYGDSLYLYVPPQFVAQPPTHRYPSTFADQIHLLGYDLAQPSTADKPILTVALYWQADSVAAPAGDYTVFVQLLDDAGQFVTGYDNPPCHRTCPTNRWQPGEFLRDEYWLPLETVQPGDYQLQIGLYDSAGQRLKVLSGPFHGEDRILLTDLTVTNESPKVSNN